MDLLAFSSPACYCSAEVLPVQGDGLNMRDVFGGEPLVDPCGTSQNFLGTDSHLGVHRDLHFRVVRER
jgi:hypothetical protein